MIREIATRLIGPDFSRALREMRAAQRLSRAELDARSQQKLQRLLAHATTNVPFYRGLPCELRAFPVMSKADYRKHSPRVFDAAGVPECRRLHRMTSGSTGQPFAFCLDRSALPVIFASHVFYDSWFHLRPFDRFMRVMSPPAAAAPLEGGTASFRLRQKLLGKMQRTYESWTQRKFPVWEVNGERAVEFWREMQAFRPKFLMGYTSTLALLAQELGERGLSLPSPLRAVITIAEQLSPERCAAISSYFGAPIINRYGLREFGSWSAQNCEHAADAFHINSELAICEILREDGTPAAPGETGRMVLTDLYNYARPFIRYFTGDLAAAIDEPCPCGRAFPRIGNIEGRSNECLRTRSGKVIGPAVLGHFLFVYNNHLQAISQYQLRQERPDRASLLVVPSPQWDEGTPARLKTDLERLLGSEMSVTVQPVAEIPLEASGKRPIIKVLHTEPRS